MRRFSGRAVHVVLLGLVAFPVFAHLLLAAQPDKQSAMVMPFDGAVQRYVMLHRQLEVSSPTIAVSANPNDLLSESSRLRQQLRRVRRTAIEGEFFTPSIAALFRRLIARAYHGNFASLMKATHDEPDELGRAIVNEQWPGTALTTMPPDLLAVLPRLPAELEYRFVHRDLVLWDVRADLIVDVLRDAIPTR